MSVAVLSPHNPLHVVLSVTLLVFAAMAAFHSVTAASVSGIVALRPHQSVTQYDL